MTTKFPVGKFALVPLDGNLFRMSYFDQGDTRVYIGQAAENMLVVAIGKKDAPMPADLEFTTPILGAGNKSGLPQYLDAVRALPDAEHPNKWTGIGTPSEDGQSWEDPARMSLPGRLSGYCYLFDPRSAI